MKCKKYKIVKCVPFQVCPRCNGTGSVYNAMIQEGTTMTYGPNTCPVCNGAMVIPMAVIPEKHDTI